MRGDLAVRVKYRRCSGAPVYRWHDEQAYLVNKCRSQKCAV